MVWATDVFGIVSIVSRSFAAYYFCQALLAAATAVHNRVSKYPLVVTADVALALLLVFVTIAAIPGD